MRDTGTWRAMEELYEQGLVKAGSDFPGLAFGVQLAMVVTTNTIQQQP